MFDVARDPSRPFVVNAGVGTVTALGTRFKVQRSENRVSVTLLEGAVGIATAGQGDARSLRLVDRKSVQWGRSGSVQVEIGGRRYIKKKKQRHTETINLNKTTK